MSNTDVNTNGTTTSADAAVLAANIETEKAAKPKKEKPAKPEKAASATIVKDVPLKDIILPEQNVRTELTGMDELIASVKEQGVLQPGIGVQLPDGKVKLTAGQRRFLASKEAGKSTMPIRIVDADDLDQHEIAMVENLQREDMNPLDKAVGIQKMMSDRDCDQKEAARRLSVSDGFISQHLSLLKLPKQVQNAVKNGKIDLAHARQLGRIKDEEKMLDLLKVAADLTVSQLQDKVEVVVAKEKAKAEAEKAKENAKKPKAKAKTEGGEDDEEDSEPSGKKSLAERYAEMEMEPLKKNDLREKLMAVALRLDKAKTEEKRAEYKYILKGMEIAAGLKDI